MCARVSLCPIITWCMLLIKRNFFTPINYCWINCSNQIKSNQKFYLKSVHLQTVQTSFELLNRYKIQYYWKKKNRPVLDITGFFFRMSTRVTAFVLRTSAFTRVRMRKKKPVISNTDKLFCFNNNVYNLYNNSVVDQINGMAYIFTLLMFRKPNKATINKNKTTNFYRSTSFRFSCIFRYFKVFQVSQMFTCGLSDLLLLAVSCFCIARIHFKSSHTRQFWT